MYKEHWRWYSIIPYSKRTFLLLLFVGQMRLGSLITINNWDNSGLSVHSKGDNGLLPPSWILSRISLCILKRYFWNTTFLGEKTIVAVIFKSILHRKVLGYVLMPYLCSVSCLYVCVSACSSECTGSFFMSTGYLSSSKTATSERHLTWWRLYPHFFLLIFSDVCDKIIQRNKTRVPEILELSLFISRRKIETSELALNKDTVVAISSWNYTYSYFFKVKFQ